MEEYDYRDAKGMEGQLVLHCININEYFPSLFVIIGA